MRDEFGDRVEPTTERVGRFVQQMLHGRMIAVDGSSGSTEEAGDRKQQKPEGFAVCD
jgi:hypothetical protein